MISLLKTQYKYLVRNKKRIAAFKQKICLCLTEYLFWLVFNFFNNAWVYIYIPDLFLLRVYSSGCFIEVNTDRIGCNPFTAHSSLIRRYTNCSFSYVMGTKLFFHYIYLKVCFCFCFLNLRTPGDLFRHLKNIWSTSELRPQGKIHDVGKLTRIFLLNCCSSTMGNVQRCKMEA